MSEMLTKYCPEWVFSICSAKTGKDFLTSDSPIISISKKFSNHLSEHYNEVKFEEILDLGEKMLQFLSEIEAGEEAVNYLNNYIHYRVMYESSGNKRKISGFFTSSFDSTKVKDYNSETSLKLFRATIFSIKNNTIIKSPPGWLITDVEDIDWLGEVFEKEVSIFDI
jgi:hypothetical protein